MPTPMKYADALRLCGGVQGQRIQEMLLNKFRDTPGGRRSGSFVDRERRYLVDRGCTAGGSRYDMWKEFVNMRPDDYWWAETTAEAIGSYERSRVVKREGAGTVGVVAGGSYSMVAG